MARSPSLAREPILHRLFPNLEPLGRLDRETIRRDLVAGTTTAVILVPQGMAYALLAGLPPVVGLYASVVPGLAYGLFGSSRQLSVGPVALDSLLVAAAVGAVATSGTADYVSAAAVLALLVGVVQLAMGLFGLGFLANFLSQPVLSGFTSGAAVLILMSQLGHLLGVSVPSNLHPLLVPRQLARGLGHAAFETAAIGAGSIALLIVLGKLAPRFPRAFLVIVAGTLLVGLVPLSGVPTIGHVPSGLPTPSLPSPTSDLLLALLPTAVVIAFVGFVESLSISRIYARQNGYTIEPGRELRALGIANLLGGLFQGFPVTGSFSRSAVNAEAGAKTPIALLVTTSLVASSLVLFAPLFHYVPKASLAAVIVVAVIGLVDLGEAERLYHVKREDLVVCCATFLSTVGFGVAAGLGVGVSSSLLWFLVRSTRPHTVVLGRIPGTRLFRNVKRQEGLVTYPGVLAVRMDAQFYFGNVSFLESELRRLEEESDAPVRAVVIDASAMNQLDSSALTALVDLHARYRERGVLLYLSTVKGPVRDVLDRGGVSQVLGARGEYRSVADAVDAALREIDSSADASAEGTKPTVFPSRTRSATDGPAAREARPYTYVI